MVAKPHHERQVNEEMRRSEAYREMYGSVPNMKAVLQQRRAIAEEAVAMTERLRKKLLARFPPVDSAGASLNATFESELWMLKHKMKQIDATIAECEPKSAARSKDSAKAADAARLPPRRKS